MTNDGIDPLKVACRAGLLHLPRHVLYHRDLDQHHIPANDALPEHHGMLITRSLQELACLLNSDVPGETATRLLCWSCKEEKLLSTSEVRKLVREHGKLIRKQEAEVVKALLEMEQDPQATPDLGFVPVNEPRRPAAWPKELSQAVQEALAQPDPCAPVGVSKGDWDRVLAARREDAGLSVDHLARLGPTVSAGEIVVSVDDVLVREPEKAHWLAIHTGRIVTCYGSRYFSGCSTVFMAYVGVVLRLCARSGASVSLLADGQAWIGTFYNELLAPISIKRYILDWFHLSKKCRLQTSMICRGRQARAALLKPLLWTLFCGEADRAIQMLEEYRPQAKNEQVLDQLMSYLRARRELIPDYKDLRRQRHYIGSGHAEKANDLIVARRQKRRGMHWREASADALAAFKTLMLNREWDRYWATGSIAIKAN